MFFHKFILNGALDIYFLKGRRNFGYARDGASFPSIITVHSTMLEMRDRVAAALKPSKRQRELF